MKAGNLRLWMTHYQRVAGTNELGEPSPYFTAMSAFNAGTMALNAKGGGDEFFNTGHMLIRVDRLFEIRYDAVKAEDRVAVGSEMYEVLAVVPTDGGRWELKCKSVS